ncbi:OmpA family protein [bacterium]|nr:OmpA family protein [bacterium]NIN92230.1 OmpA family protein [bacterium]NIO18372.1 OmpA family protein [bacterium]NIO73351.1 OmpA family protein [bacterium]
MDMERERKAIRRRGRSPIWLTIYSDLMTNLMLFFLMLFGTSRMATEVQKTIYKTIRAQFSREEEIFVKKEEDAIKKMLTYVEERRLRGFATVKVSEQRVKIMLADPVLFDLGESELKPSAIVVLRQVARLLEEIPNAVLVEGHTDDRPVIGDKFRSNWELSTARAFSVIRYFIEQENITPERLSAVGYGEYRPLYPNDTEENRAKNRRIEINIVRIQ